MTFTSFNNDTASCELPGGFTATARLEHDSDTGAPWDAHDDHGIVSEWTMRAKLPGERVLCEDHGSKRFYDIHGTLAIAKRDGWDGEGRTAKEKVANAVEQDFERLRAWCRDDWSWIGVVVTVSKAGINLGNASLWGIESDAGDYLIEVANELISEAMDEADATLAKLAE